MKRALAALLLGALAQVPLWGLAPLAAQAGGQAAEVFDKVSPSVYVVYSSLGDGRMMLGSGVVLQSGVLVTNFHVINGAQSVRVVHGDEQLTAYVGATDPHHDLAALRVPGLRGRPVRVGDAGAIRVGQSVYAIGSPRGLELTLSEGIVSSMRQTTDGNMIQTTAPISPGSSGGGLFDGHGRLLGFTTMQAVDGQNLNFAVPVEWLHYIQILPTVDHSRDEFADSSPEPEVVAMVPADPLSAAQPGAALRGAPAASAAPAVAPPLPVQTPPAPKSGSSRLYLATAVIVILLLLIKPLARWLTDDSASAAAPMVMSASAMTVKDKFAPFRALAREEIKSGPRDEDTWLQALEHSGGNEMRATVAYIEMRTPVLHKAEMDRRWEEARNTSPMIRPRGPTA